MSLDGDEWISVDFPSSVVHEAHSLGPSVPPAFWYNTISETASGFIHSYRDISMSAFAVIVHGAKPIGKSLFLAASNRTGFHGGLLSKLIVQLYHTYANSVKGFGKGGAHPVSPILVGAERGCQKYTSWAD